MTISGRPEIGLEDFPWTLAAHSIDVLRTSVDPKMVQILTKNFSNYLDFIKSCSNDCLLTSIIHFLKTFFY